MRVVNVDRSAELGARVEVADRYWTRLVGLLGRASLAEGEGLWIEPCNSVHMLFMRFPIDVVFTSAEGRVVGVRHGLLPWRMTWLVPGARAALELPAGVAARTGTVEGDRIAREPACS